MPEITYREALRQALREEMQRDTRVLLIGEDIGAYGGTYAVTKGLLEEFGEERVRDAPIAEAAIVGAAIGAAMGGLRPVAELMTINFSLLAFDQIVNNAAKIRYMFGGQFAVPLVLRTATVWGQLGPTHSQSFEAWFAHVPGLKVVTPTTPYDAKGLLKAAIRDPDPVLFLEHNLLYSTKGEVPEGDYVVPLGAAEVKRRGRDVTIITYSRMLVVALAAAARLAERGIEAEVIDLRTLRPLDGATIAASIRRTGRAIVVGEDWRFCGMTAELAAQAYELAFDYLDAPVQRIACADVPRPYARNLELAVVPSEEHIARAVEQLVGRRAPDLRISGDHRQAA